MYSLTDGFAIDGCLHLAEAVSTTASPVRHTEMKTSGRTCRISIGPRKRTTNVANGSTTAILSSLCGVSRLTEVSPLKRGASQLLLAQDVLPTVLVAVVVFVLAYDNGGYGESARDSLAILLWWTVVLAIGLGIWPRARVPVAAVVCTGLLAAFGLFTLLSTRWAADAAGAYAEFTRIALYVAVLVVVVGATRRLDPARVTDGIGLGIAAIAVVALTSRLFPSVFPHSNRAISQFLPEGSTRLSFPLGYWNGLAVFVALGIPLLLRSAVGARSAFVRGLSLAPIPAIAGIVLLASSRIGIVTAAVATTAFLLLTEQRWSAAAASIVAVAGSALAVFALYDRNALVNGPLSSQLARNEGRSAALIVAGICILVAVAYGAGTALFPAGLSPSTAAGWALFFAAVALVAVGIAAAHPIRRFDAFKRPPTQLFQRGHGIQEHLLSKDGNGRWQLWQGAWKEFESEPLNGRGAGSYQAWWAQHGAIRIFVEHAHSLYLETLGELGIIGFLLLAGSFATGLVAAGRRILRLAGEQRTTLAAATAAFAGFAVAAAVDWMWQLTIVALVAFACLGLVVGHASSDVERFRPVRLGDRPLRGRGSRYGFGVVVAVCAWLLIVAIAIPLLAGVKLNDSQQAAAGGNSRTAVEDALAARSIEPWSSAPYLQVALIAEQENDLPAAEQWIGRAVGHDRSDWRLWLIQARIQAKRGEVVQATRSFEKAKRLNPHSALFQTVTAPV